MSDNPGLHHSYQGKMSADETKAHRTTLSLTTRASSSTQVAANDGVVVVAAQTSTEVQLQRDEIEFVPERGKLLITKKPMIGEIYWCSFPEDSLPPEFGKTRPVMIVSLVNELGTYSTVVPLTRSPQEVTIDKYSIKLSFRPHPSQQYESWVVASHVYTISHWRLAPFIYERKSHYPRVGEGERQAIFDLMQSRLPANNKLRQIVLAEEKEEIRQNQLLKAQRLAERAAK